MDETYEIYLGNCGCQCPSADCECSNRAPGGVCLLVEPWFDCDLFIKERWVEIGQAEADIENGE